MKTAETLSIPPVGGGVPSANGALPSGLREQFQSQRIVVERPHEVADYLGRYPEIAALLPDICGKLRQTFGAAELALSVYTDPEIHDRYLSLYVRFEHYAPGVMAQIEPAAAQFDDALATRAGHLLITTDFRPPRGNDGV